MALCLTYRVNLGLSLPKTKQALKDIHNIFISHQSIANYCKTAAICVKPFVDHFDYKTGTVFTADETYIKIRGVKGYIWFIMDAAKRSIIGYRISDNRGVGPCIFAMRMAFRHLKNFRNTSVLLLTDTALILSPPISFSANTAKSLNLTSHR